MMIRGLISTVLFTSLLLASPALAQNRRPWHPSPEKDPLFYTFAPAPKLEIQGTAKRRISEKELKALKSVFLKRTEAVDALGNQTESSTWIGDGESDGMSIADVAFKVWDIIQENKAVAEVSSNASQALPEIAKENWEALTGWKPMNKVTFKLSLTNLYGITVVEVLYDVALRYGGSVGGKGKYIASAQIRPKSVDVLWGFNLNVSVQEVSIENIGTEADPVASIVLDVVMNYGSIMRQMSESQSYRFDGTGMITDLNNGTKYFDPKKSKSQKRD